MPIRDNITKQNLVSKEDREIIEQAVVSTAHEEKRYKITNLTVVESELGERLIETEFDTET